MDVKYINPFTSSTVGLLKTIANLPVSRGKLNIGKGAKINQGIAVVLEIKNDLSGYATFDFSDILAIKLTESLNTISKTDTPKAQFDRLMEDTLLEIGNMICGRAITQLSTMEIDCDQSTPYLVRNVGGWVIPSDYPTLTMELSSPKGDMNIYLGIRETVQAEVAS